ncbi:putative transcription regulator A20-like family [Helianthus annuus]|nr:putative transcription regulator A20-like family [Helianthus annuus]
MTVDRTVVKTNKEMKVINRCSGCWKRVGLTGFRCRCEEVDFFCCYKISSMCVKNLIYCR